MDTLTAEHRSRVMSRIRGKDTQPEMAVRRTIHALGYRFRLHRRDLPGSPDIVLPKLKKAIFVHGCFWHRHARCKYAYVPKSNVDFWSKKFDANVRRDQASAEALKALQWNVLTVWECETKDIGKLFDVLKRFLSDATR
ncbi:very short patch repair endonuclease [Bordetella genomosp. 11]|uniref:Very short patch repair endonuclease n=1 Tax=Bordetella genomosp. 11 TaxID=1416808 RepID=A0A261UKG0_9BORD|nr:very short patch repair endonuclease [Bordetella genomosp. 11]OZI62125.1 very short patch repair endonuclease [Bordetella genomosp. 11]